VLCCLITARAARTSISSSSKFVVVFVVRSIVVKVSAAMAPSSAKPNGRRRWGLSALHRKLHRASTSDEITQSGRTAQNPTAHLNVEYGR
jgi:hypothetical protein